MHDSITGGMYGALSIRGRGERRPDREFVVFFSALNGFQTINGRAFVGNTPVFRSRVGEVVQWDVLTLGDEFHTFHVHGHRWLTAAGVPEDTRTRRPGRELPRALPRGRARHVAVPLPRRAAHDARDDRPLPGAAMSAALVAALALAATPVDIPGRYFDPPRVTVAPGATVVWRSHDGEPHTVVAAGAFASPVLARHGEFAHRFDTAGSFPYVCSLHPFMRGSVEVVAATAPAVPLHRTGLQLRAHGSQLVARVSPPRPGSVLALERHFRDRYAWRQVAHRRLKTAGRVRFAIGNARRRARVVLYEDGAAVATSPVLRPWKTNEEE